ncbi:Acetaldehyde dehydrogenase, acetylating, (EC 1.2.1.10) in gene cluster for degradation of phenols, cresols, catechol [Pseudomonas sp. FEN]|nr:Acetaldehyde dehydrogenase, acetylating, (EC 1.2.1.10) in gene cluster for degradation of phenols, cresols, catechol [Pseudomonas sp. FEN]
MFRKANLFAIDMTPAKIGAICVPSINLDSMANERNVNLITCGGQASIPLAYAIAQSFQSLEYIEVASTIASNSAGLDPRKHQSVHFDHRTSLAAFQRRWHDQGGSEYQPGQTWHRHADDSVRQGQL